MEATRREKILERKMNNKEGKKRKGHGGKKKDEKKQ